MKLQKEDYILFENLMQLHEQQLLNYMTAYIASIYGKEKITRTDSYVLAEGDLPIALLAHLDTVTETATSHELIYDYRKNILCNLYAIGFDDRAGVVAIIKLLTKGYRPSIILTTGEESGCVGSYTLIGDCPQCPFLIKPKYLIQLDRRGDNDCVFYYDVNTEFHNYIESFGYFKTARGTFTDISTIAPAWRIAAVNLSIGYYNEHTSDEYLDVTAWYNIIDQVEIMIKNLDTCLEYKYIEDQTTTYSWKPISQNYQIKCDICNQLINMDEAYDIITKDYGYGLVCQDCLINHCDYCSTCKEYYEVNENTYNHCPSCKQQPYFKVIDYKGYY